MSLVTCHMTISVDGFVAGPRQTREDPIGEGHRLHQWIFRADEPGHEADARLRDQMVSVRGEWGDEDWRGWGGEEPPYHAPVFVLTHYPHAPIEMKGGTTFHFVTEGFDAAFRQAQAVAGDAPIDIAGGASTVQQAF